MVIVLEMGLISPPVGVNVFIVKSVVPDVPIETIFAGIMGALREGFALFDAGLQFRMCNETFSDLACSPDIPPPQVNESAESLLHRLFSSGLFLFPDNTDIRAFSSAAVDVFSECVKDIRLRRRDGRCVLMS